MKNEIFSEEFKSQFRVSDKDFIRNRKQNFPMILLFMINLLKKSLSLEIENFITYFKHQPFSKFTKSAFVQARRKIKPEVFKQLSYMLLEEFYTDNDPAIKLWRGFRLLAIDSSRITLPMTTELKSVYGVTKNQTDSSIVQARCSVVYDVLNKYVLDGVLASPKVGERDLALSHLDYCNTQDLLIYDRGYPSFNFIYQHNEKKINFLMRVKTTFSQTVIDFVRSNKCSQVVDIFPGKNTKLSDKPYSKNTPIQVRLVRVELPNNKVEILMTSLDCQEYPSGLFKKLYAKRWQIETFYDELKNKLKIEHFSGYSNQTIQQDFYAALFISNIQTLIISEINDELDENKNKKHIYKVNSNLSYGFLKNRVIQLFLVEDSNQNTIIEELKVLFKSHLIPIRPNRSYERKSGKYRTRMKPKITKNQKDAI